MSKEQAKREYRISKKSNKRTVIKSTELNEQIKPKFLTAEFLNKHKEQGAGF